MAQVDVRRVLFALMIEQPAVGNVTGQMSAAELDLKASLEGILRHDNFYSKADSCAWMQFYCMQMCRFFVFRAFVELSHVL